MSLCGKLSDGDLIVAYGPKDPGVGVVGIFMGQMQDITGWHWKIFSGNEIRELPKKYWRLEKFIG